MKTQRIKIETIIKKLIKEFQTSPDSFFSECDFQYQLFCLLNANGFNTPTTTKDGKIITLVYPEYPSVNRIQLSRGKGYRVWYDLAILNPEFIRNSGYQTVLARDERDAKLWGENLLAAFEFKFFPKKRKNDISSVREDCLKLSLCPEIKNKYVLVFSNYTVTLSEIQTNKSNDIKSYWITPTKAYSRFGGSPTFEK